MDIREIIKRLQQRDLQLPTAPSPAAAYVGVRRHQNLAFTAGQIPLVDGSLWRTGRVGAEVTLEDASQAAKIAALNCVAQLQLLDAVEVVSVIRLGVFVASDKDFTNQHLVANGASELMEYIFGEQGHHARSAVACPRLPLDAPVEVEAVFEIK